MNAVSFLHRLIRHFSRLFVKIKSFIRRSRATAFKSTSHSLRVMLLSEDVDHTGSDLCQCGSTFEGISLRLLNLGENQMEASSNCDEDCATDCSWLRLHGTQSQVRISKVPMQSFFLHIAIRWTNLCLFSVHGPLPMCKRKNTLHGQRLSNIRATYCGSGISSRQDGMYLSQERAYLQRCLDERLICTDWTGLVVQKRCRMSSAPRYETKCRVVGLRQLRIQWQLFMVIVCYFVRGCALRGGQHNHPLVAIDAFPSPRQERRWEMAGIQD